MDNKILDQETAKQALTKIRYELGTANDIYHDATSALREAILDIRPRGIVTVPQMAEAIGKNRNYIDTLWSASGVRLEGATRTRTGPDEGPDSPPYADQVSDILTGLRNLANAQYRSRANASTVRAERDRIVVMIYTSKIFGPNSIATYLGIDRNHVLRIVRNAGVAPAHRTNIKNQHTKVDAGVQLELPVVTDDNLGSGDPDQLELYPDGPTEALTPSINPFHV